MRPNPLLEIENLCVTFKTDEGLVQAVNGVSLSVDPGQIIGVVGESGCGKSVTSLAVMGLIPQPPGDITSGRIQFKGQNLLDLSETQYQQMRGNQISMTSLNPLHRIGRQIEEVLILHKKASGKAASDLAVHMLDKVRIPDPARRAREFPHQLSGGMRQRVMIAMALACAPKLLIADEPTTALDVTIQAQILTLMNELKQDLGTAIMLITHDLGVVAETADQVAVMYARRIIESCDVKTIFSNPLHPYTQGLLDRPVPQDKLLQAIPGMVPSLTDLPRGCPFHDRCAHAFSPCAKTVPDLKDTGFNHKVRCFLHER
ncbi:MAG: ABC transporter ATP-binding protein [Desulfobacter sp.]|nr:ABC transporter ATP-binding protein [Desulfobacter sp.]